MTEAVGGPADSVRMATPGFRPAPEPRRSKTGSGLGRAATAETTGTVSEDTTALSQGVACLDRGPRLGEEKPAKRPMRDQGFALHKLHTQGVRLGFALRVRRRPRYAKGHLPMAKDTDDRKQQDGDEPEIGLDIEPDRGQGR